MQHNPFESICEFIKDHFNVPYLYIRIIDDKRLSVVFKPVKADHVILLVYKVDNGDYVIQFDKDNATIILRKTRFNDFVALDYNNPDKLFDIVTDSFSDVFFRRVLGFLNARFVEVSLYDYLSKVLPNGFELSVKPAVMTYKISPTLKLQVTEILNDTNALELQFNDNDGTIVLTKNRNGTEIMVNTKCVDPKGEALEFFNAFKEDHGIKESEDMNDLAALIDEANKTNEQRAKNANVRKTDLLNLRDQILKAIQKLPTHKRTVQVNGQRYIRYDVTLIHWDKTISLSIGIEGDACVIRSSETYAIYSFSFSSFGNISMQRISNPNYPEENIGASLTSDTVNEVLCYLKHQFKLTSKDSGVSIPATTTENNMNPKYSKIDSLFDNITKMVSDLSCATMPGDSLKYIINRNNFHMKCSIDKRSDGVAITVNGQKVYKFYFDNLNAISLAHTETIADNFDSVSLDILNRLRDIYNDNNQSNVTVQKKSIPALPEKKEDNYPVIIRTGNLEPTVNNIQSLIAEGMYLVEEAYRLDNESVTVSDTVAIADDGAVDGVRRSKLRNTRIYHVSSDKLIVGDMLVVLPVNKLPEVRAQLAHSILVHNSAAETMIGEHDYLYGQLIREKKLNNEEDKPLNQNYFVTRSEQLYTVNKY